MIIRRFMKGRSNWIYGVDTPLLAAGRLHFSDVLGLEGSVLTKTKRTALYFAHPYSSWERGSNENHNGIIRRFLPKGTDFAFIKAKSVREIQDWMNTYPRKILNGFTPLRCFKEEFGLQDITIRLLEVC